MYWGGLKNWHKFGGTIMTKIIYKYGCMNSGKSLELIKIAHNYMENGIESLILKPELDQKVKNKVSSRTGLSLDAIEIKEDDPKQVLTILEKSSAKIYLIEECNFLSKEVIDTIIDYGYNHDIESIIFFGIKVDFRGNLFPGSKRIIERCDKMEESTSVCWCGKKARQNGRVINGKLTKDGPTILVDIPENNVEYVMLCNYHFHTGELGPNYEV